MKVALVSLLDPRDVEAWSGIFFHMGTALEAEGHEVVWVGPLESRRRETLDLLSRAWKRMPLPPIVPIWSHWAARGYARTLARRLPQDVDFILSPWSVPIAYLKTNLPIVLWADATVAGLIDFYPWATGVSRRSAQRGIRLDARGVRRCAVAAYSSRWAANSARQEYGVPDSKVRVIPFGANLQPDDPDVVNATIAAREASPIRLFHVSTDWHRKGSDVAIDVARILHEGGSRVELTIVGASRDLTDAPFVRCLGFVSKRTEEGAERFRAELRRAHFLLQPSRAECFGVAVCEAFSMGVPALCTEVGGMGEIVQPGVTGALVQPESAAEDLAGFVSDVFSDPARYEQMARSARADFEDRLNWPTSVRALLSAVAAS